MPRIQTIHTPSELKNHIINGALDFWQERVSTVTTVNTASSQAAYTADMLKYESGGASNKNYSIQRSTDVPTVAQCGMVPTYSALWTQITGIPSLAAGDYLIPFEYQMEGFDYQKLHNKTVTFGFWYKSSVVGTYSFALSRQGFDRTYVTTFSVNLANTWEYKSITVALDSISGWFFDNSIGLRIFIGTIAGSTYTTSSLNAWNSSAVLNASTATNWAASAGATMRMTMLSMVEGSLGMGPTGFQRAGKTIQQELALCQRYYEHTYKDGQIPRTNVGNGQGEIQVRWPTAPSSSDELYAALNFRVHKRALPTLELWSPAGVQNQFTRDGGGTLAAQVWNAGSNYYAAVATNSAASNTAVHRIHLIADSRL